MARWLFAVASGVTMLCMAGAAQSVGLRSGATNDVLTPPTFTHAEYHLRRVRDWDGHPHWHHDWDRGGDWGDRVHTHIYFGVGPVWSPYYWGAPPAYYYPPPRVYVTPPPPTVYISPDTGDAQPYYWYYCPSPKGYYPYVKQCPPGWTKVVPHPPKH